MNVRQQLEKLARYKFAAGIAVQPPVPPPVQTPQPLQNGGFPRALQPSMPVARAPQAGIPQAAAPAQADITQNMGASAPPRS